MAHMIEIIDGKAQMAWAGETPWHGLGTSVGNDLTPAEMMKAAGLDWNVVESPTYIRVNDEEVSTGYKVLVRETDKKILTMVGEGWHPVQNSEAFDFFTDFVAKGDMEMHTAGSLDGGRRVWALAKVNESFELFGGKDRVDSYLLFSNPHKYGYCIDISFTPIRVVCNNTITLALNSTSKNRVRLTHAVKFNPDLVKETLGVAKEKLASYKDKAEFLSKKRYTKDDMKDYFMGVFPATTQARRDKGDLSRNAETAISFVDTQPGAEFGAGSFWQLFNASTFVVDHVLGRSADTRLHSAWFGATKQTKLKALDLAVEMAELA
jgi:phage/plasmid-like protein (TIGR03299 family)